MNLSTQTARVNALITLLDELPEGSEAAKATGRKIDALLTTRTERRTRAVIAAAQCGQWISNSELHALY